MEKTEYSNKALKTAKKVVKKEITHEDALEYAHKHNITVKQAKILLNRD